MHPGLGMGEALQLLDLQRREQEARGVVRPYWPHDTIVELRQLPAVHQTINRRARYGRSELLLDLARFKQQRRCERAFLLAERAEPHGDREVHFLNGRWFRLVADEA
jgi:hypothetical protein